MIRMAKTLIKLQVLTLKYYFLYYITQIRQNFIIKQTFPFSIMIQRKNGNLYQETTYSTFKIFQTNKNVNRAIVEYTEMSPRQSLSPLKRNNLYSKASNRSKSPLINRSKNNYSQQNRNLSPLRKNPSRLFEESEVQAISFSKLSKKSSNYSANQRSDNGFMYSKNYLQSDRFANTDTNLFTKLAAKLNESNRGNLKGGSTRCANDFSNRKIFSQGLYSQQQDAQSFRAIPQSSRFNNSNKKSFTNLFINNVATIQSIQSPQDQGFSFNYLQNQTNCQQFQNQSQIQKKCQQSIKQKRLLQPSMKKKESNQNNKNSQNYLQKNEGHAYLDLDSFGFINTKKQIINQSKQVKPLVRPFQQIQATQVVQSINQTNHPQIRLLNFLDPAKGELSSQQFQQDPQFQTIRLILDKLQQSCHQKKIQSEQMGQNVNVSLQASRDSLNMNPFL